MVQVFYKVVVPRFQELQTNEVHKRGGRNHLFENQMFRHCFKNTKLHDKVKKSIPSVDKNTVISALVKNKKSVLNLKVHNRTARSEGESWARHPPQDFWDQGKSWWRLRTVQSFSSATGQKLLQSAGGDLKQHLPAFCQRWAINAQRDYMCNAPSGTNLSCILTHCLFWQITA